MTLDDFAAKCGKRKDTVSSWLKKGYVPGAYFIEATSSWYIPDGARVPYMKRKPKNGGAKMYKSIVKAVSEGYGVCAELYNITHQRFEVYMNQLIVAGILTSYSEDDIKYYETTLETDNFLKMQGKPLRDFIVRLAEAGSRGATEGFVASIGA